MKYWTSLFLLIALLTSNSYAQEKDKLKGLDIDFGFSPIAYRGDLQEKFNKWSSAFILGVQTASPKRIKPHLQIGIGSIVGQNISYPTELFEAGVPNTSFYTTFFKANLDLKITVFKHKKKDFNLYVAPGIGFIRFTPYDDAFDKLESQTTTREKGETYSTNAAIIPTSIGLNYTFLKKLKLQTELSYFNPQTDYIDNISAFGVREKKDNIFSWRFSIVIPVGHQHPKPKKVVPIEPIEAPIYN